MKLYVASSWRNGDRYREILTALRADGHDCYDFRNPWPGNQGFSWAEIDPTWQQWTESEFVGALQHPLAQRGFRSDFEAMHWADGCVLVLPCGRSAHIEAGWFCGRGKPCWIVTNGPTEPELMYLMARVVTGGAPDLLRQINFARVNQLTKGLR